MLRLTRIADYGFAILGVMSRDGVHDTHNARDLAEQTGISQPMASKILKALARAGLVTSIRGTKGGYRLTRPPEAISVAEVIESLQGPIAMTECLVQQSMPGACDVMRVCPVRPGWQRINHAIRSALNDMALTDLMMTEHAVPVGASTNGADGPPRRREPGLPS